MRGMIKYKYWIPVILWMAFIFWMSTETFSQQNTSAIIEPAVRFLAPTASEEEIDKIHGVVRKLAHVTEYLILGMLLFRAFKRGSADRRVWRYAFYSLVITALYAVSDEFHQSFIVVRTASLIDVCFDLFGGILAQCICVSWSLRNRS